MRNYKEWRSEETPLNETFEGWYDFHHGKWAEVEDAAQEDPILSEFLRTARNHMQNPRDQFDFKGLQFKKWADIAKFIGKRVEKSNQGHRYDILKRKKEMLSPQSPTPNTPNQPIPRHYVSPNPGDSQFQRNVSDTADTVSSPIAAVNQGGFISYLKEIDKRLKNVEDKIGIHSGGD